MRIATVLIAATALPVCLSACATTGGGYGRAEVIRYHLGEPLERGTVVVEPAEGGDGLSGQPFAQAVSRQLGGAGYVPAAPGGTVQFIAVVDVRRRAFDGPPRQSGLSIGLGGGSYSGGRHGGGIGLGGGVSFPVGGSRRNVAEDTELSVTIKRRADQSPVWEGHAHMVAGRDTTQVAVAEKLAGALFTGFPGESGRTIEVR